MVITLYSKFFEALKTRNISFCNWKGSNNLTEYFAGKGDIDLFVPISYKKDFKKIAEEFGFRCLTSYQANHPYIEHFFAIDEVSLEFIHLHVYFKIVTGEHISKNYIIPLDEYLVRNVKHNLVVPTLKNKAKLNVFLIRYYLKIGSILGLFQYFRELDKYNNEWNSLDLSEENEPIQDIGLTKEVVDDMRRAYEHSGLFSQLILSIKIKSLFKNYKRKSFFEHQLFNIKNIGVRFINKLLLKRKKFLDPGFVIGICGLDGSGKSTLVKKLKEKFSTACCVKVIHLGRPSPSSATLLISPMINVFSQLRRLKVSPNDYKGKPQNNDISLLQAIRYVILAYDRKKASIRAHKIKEKGYIVICDRYPGIMNGKMDSPKIPHISSSGCVYKYLHKKENQLYNSIKAAEIIFHLSVPLEVSIQRNNQREKFGKETDSEIRDRYVRNKDAVFLGKNYNFVDATPPFTEVLAQVSNSIWNFKP